VEAEAGRLQVLGQSGPHIEILSQKITLITVLTTYKHVIIAV
jgi:hypothetical protein